MYQLACSDSAVRAVAFSGMTRPVPAAVFDLPTVRAFLWVRPRSEVRASDSLSLRALSHADVSIFQIHAMAQWHMAPLPEPHTLLPLPEASLNILLTLAHGDLAAYVIVGELWRPARWFEGNAGFDSRPAEEQKLITDALYQSIQRMKEQGLIVETERPMRTSWEDLRERPTNEKDDDQRRHWRITSYGFTVVQAEVRRLEQLVKVAKARGLASEAEP